MGVFCADRSGVLLDFKGFGGEQDSWPNSDEIRLPQFISSRPERSIAVFQAEAGIEVFASAYRRVLSPAGRVIIGLLLLNFCGCGRYAGEDLIKP